MDTTSVPWVHGQGECFHGEVSIGDGRRLKHTRDEQSKYISSRLTTD